MSQAQSSLQIGNNVIKQKDQSNRSELRRTPESSKTHYAEYDEFANSSSYLKLVKRIATSLHRRMPPTVLLNDLVSAGNVGLAEALNAYDPIKGGSFVAYATFRIRGAMIDAVRDADPASRRLRFKQKDLNRATASLTIALSRTPEPDELAEHLGISLTELFALQASVEAIKTESWTDCSHSDPEAQPSLVATEYATPESLCLAAEEKQLLMNALDALPERLRLVLTLRYYEELSFKQIASVLEIAESRAWQLHRDAMQEIAKRMRL